MAIPDVPSRIAVIDTETGLMTTPWVGWCIEVRNALNTMLGQAEVTAAEVAHDVNAVFSDTEVEAALDALGGKINGIIDSLQAAKLMD